MDARKHELVVVGDVRYPNEANLIRSLGGHVIQIKREGAGLTGKAAKHPSETALDRYRKFTATLINEYPTEWQWKNAVHAAVEELLNAGRSTRTK